jgi:alkylation response protein AidB-like acyl-CoA dehydrogenase
MSTTIDLQSLIHELGPSFAEGAAERDEGDIFVAENYAALKEHKVFSAMVPSELGGGGAGHGEMCRFVRGLARYCGATALSLSMHQHLVAAAVFNYRNGKPGQQLLEKVAAKELILISTGANDWLGSNGSVERTDGGFLVSARKPFASGSPMGDVLVTSAPYEDPQEGWQVLHFPVPLAAEGVTFADDWKALGMRATGSQTVILERVFVPEEAVVLRRPRDHYHPAWNAILTVAMPLIMSAYLGVAEAAAEIATAQAKRRSYDPTIPYLLGELTNHLTTAQIAQESMVAIANDWEFAATNETANAILVRKTITAKAALAVGETALETAGGPGFHRGFGLERLLRDLHGSKFHPLAEKRQLLFSGRHALGLDPVGETAEPRFQAAAE